MWYEARKREKATQKLFDDHRKRAEKRREENKIDPRSLLQVNGFKSKLCLDPSVYKQAVKSLVAWQGDKNVSIDRFDVRATLTSIPHEKQPLGKSVLDINESESLKSLLCYERFRLLIKNDVNKTPEQLRLELISKNQVLTGPHLKKLQYDSFGAYTDVVSKHSLNHHQQPFKTFNRGKDTIIKKDKPAGSANYSAVPPPEQMVAKPEIAGYVLDKNLGDKQRFNVASVVDLDDVEDGDDLDAINATKYEERKSVDEVVIKYGLTTKEFLLLAKRDKHDTSLNSLLKEFEDLKNETKLDDERQNEQVYGPILPPDHLESGSPDSPSSSSANEDSPRRQRSPSGSSIPLRNDNMDGASSDQEEKPDSPADSSPVSLPVQKEAKPTNEDACCSRVLSQSDTRHSTRRYKSSSSSPEPVYSARESRKRQHSSTNTPNESDPPLPPRRASTPLAYKKNRRSSRSLSRERRASSNSSYHNHHRRHRDSSKSSRRRRRRRSSSSSSSSSRY